jgi:hypothetical protein
MLRKRKNKGSEVLIARIFSIKEETHIQETTQLELMKVLKEFADIFAKSSTLPLKKVVDNSVPLIPNSKSVNSSPYRYLHFQKLKIEIIIKELL